MCVLDYNFAILNEAFLIHKPGIKTSKHHSSETDQKKVSQQKQLITNTIIPQLQTLYGKKKGCGSL